MAGIMLAASAKRAASVVGAALAAAFVPSQRVVAADSAVNWDHPLNRGRAAWWYTPPGIAAAGSRLLNLVGRNHGTTTGVWQPTPYGVGIQYDGSVTSTTAPTTNIWSNFSSCCWARIDVLPSTPGSNLFFSDGYDFGGGGASRGGWGFGVGDGAGSAGSKMTGLASAIAWIDSGYTFPRAGWYRTGISVTGSTNWRFYVNGVLVGTATASAIQVPNTSLSAVGWGIQNGTTLNKFNGVVTDTSVWSRVLPDSLFAADYQLSAVGYTGSDSPLRFAGTTSYFW